MVLVNYKDNIYAIHLNTIARMFEAKRTSQPLEAISCTKISVDKFCGYVISSQISLNELVAFFPQFMQTLNPLLEEEIENYQNKIAQQKEAFYNFFQTL